MSQDVGPSRKEKREQRNADRRKNGKKRKLAETLEDEDSATATATVDQAVEVPTDQKSPQNTDDIGSYTSKSAQDSRAKAEATSKPKKRRKVADGTAAKEDGTTQESSTKPRFILFIGNLPYSATDASLQAHFEKLSPFTLRHRTDSKTKKSKGFAFLEFENYDRMKTCLKLYHHSMFDPEAKENGGSGKGNGKGGRRINVELTAGGGGKTENRKEKIKAKNVRLEEQRKRRAEAERKESERKDRKAGKPSKQDADGILAPPEAPHEEANPDTDAIHPSRRTRVAA